MNLSNVQGNVLPGFNKDHQAFVLVSFPGRLAGQRWLRGVRGQVASASEVYQFRDAFKVVQGLRAGQRQVTISGQWANLALSWRGLRVLLGPAEVATMPAAFRANQVPFCAAQPSTANAHALLQLAADDPAHLDAELDRQRAAMVEAQVREIGFFRGHRLDNQVEHFGFRDGVSRLVVDGTPEAAARTGAAASDPVVPAGEFVFGERDAAGQHILPGPPWTRDGTFLAFMQLEQDVRAFRDAVQRSAQRLKLPYAQFGARMVGRAADGTLPPTGPPRLSHVGRAKPSWVPGIARHRIIRRGVSYGQPLSADGNESGERGLLFVSYQADLVRQFEQVWRVWLNGPDFPGPGAHRDGLVGQPLGAASAARPVALSRGAPTAGVDQLSLPQFVRPRYGGYFMAPSLTALVHLGGGA